MTKLLFIAQNSIWPKIQNNRYNKTSTPAYKWADTSDLVAKDTWLQTEFWDESLSQILQQGYNLKSSNLNSDRRNKNLAIWRVELAFLAVHLAFFDIPYFVHSRRRSFETRKASHRTPKIVYNWSLWIRYQLDQKIINKNLQNLPNRFSRLNYQLEG